MAVSVEEHQKEQPQVVDDDEDEPLNGDDDEDFEDEEEESETFPDKAKMENLFRRISTERIPLRVHDVLIKGNTKTKDWLIESEVEALKSTTTVQELIQAATVANARLRRLEIFDSVNITLDSGPPELPGTANVIVEVAETKNPITGDIGVFSKPEARSWSLEGSLKLKNLFGFWGPLGYFSSYQDRALGLSLGLISSRNHELAYNVSWRTLMDPSQMASRSIRRQLGHGLLSSLKYTFKIDRRNSPLRPTRGYAFVSTSQIGGLVPDYRSLRFLRQEFDLHYAFPLGFYNAALNFGASCGVIFPWGYGGLGLTEPRRQIRGNSSDGSSETSPGRDSLGGDFALTAFADLSFDLPLRVLREAGIHGHFFACAGNLTKLTENAYRDFSFQKYRESVRSSTGFGIIIPTKLFRMEVNYCYILKQLEHDRGKTGVQFSFSSSL
ncbi:outer membrane OMP85 family protein [Actinidia rufa]|uniref:Outer membrane OMP85 family protein n=1 Tax=Actinidia rufa TaxID=165716 RepID=A0A7J0ECW5_9ERIC|nr:outer membrane OMP85 family protein [Actinidia rufa]